MINIKLEGGYRNAHQRLSIGLGTKVYELKFDWNTRMKQWFVDVIIDEEEVVRSCGFLPGSNLLHGVYGYGYLYCQGKQPTLDNLGIDCRLIWVSDDEVRK